MDIIINAFGDSLLVVFLAYGVYWLTEWIKSFLTKVLKSPVDSVYHQPIALILGTTLCTLVMFNYDFRPFDFGLSKWVLGDYIFQGMLISAFSGYLYDKFFK